jgi:hypothetical protein
MNMKTATQNEQIIRDAISRSISHTEIVHVTVDESDTCRIHELVDSAVTGDWDYSDENRGDDGCEVLDVYSLAEAADQWRIRVTFAS